MATGISLINEVNMTNCSKHRRCFFEKYESIDCNLLIAYWIMAGYLNPVNTVQEAYEKGLQLLKGLTDEGILYYEDMDTIAADANLDRCSHRGNCIPANIGFFDLLDLHHVAKVTIMNGMLKSEDDTMLLIDGDYLYRFSHRVILSANRLKCIACFKPKTTSLNSLLANVNNLSVLLLRDCEEVVDFSLKNLTNLTVLEISRANLKPTTLRRLSVPISELTQLKFLSLSHFSLRDSPYGQQNFTFLVQLRYLILRDCYDDFVSQSFKVFSCLEMLDLSHFVSKVKLNSVIFCSPKLQIVDISECRLDGVPELEDTTLTCLFLRNSDLEVYGKTKHPCSVQVLDLSNNLYLKEVDLSQHDDLQALHLSNTRVSLIHSISDGVRLQALVLQGCGCLVKLPALDKLESLEVLDLSGCRRLTELPDLSKLQKLKSLDLSRTQVTRLPVFANPSHLQHLLLEGLALDSLETLASLSNLVQLDLCDVKTLSPRDFRVGFLQSLEKLQVLNLSRTSVTELPSLIKLTSLKRLLLEGCLSLTQLPDLKVLTRLQILELPFKDLSCKLSKLVLKNPSGGGRLNSEDDDSGRNAKQPTDLKDLLPRMQIGLKSVRLAIATTMDCDNIEYMQKMEMVRVEAECIERHINSLKSSSNCDKVKELLLHIEDVTHFIEKYKFSQDVPVFHRVLEDVIQTLTKLKLLVPRVQASSKNESVLVTKHLAAKDNKNGADDDIVQESVGLEILQVETTSLQSPYDSLTDAQKKCLFCFSIFTSIQEKEKSTTAKGVLLWRRLEIRKKVLIYWWIGEGFTDHHPKENSSAEEVAEQILKVLADKGFIQPVMEKGRETGRCCMHPFVHTFVTEKAEEDGFFDFGDEKTQLKPSFARSHRACLLKSQDKFPSSCQLWAKLSTSLERLKTFKSVRTLFNVNESIIGILPEWFSEMKDLSVLHLGSWRYETSEHIEVGDQKFMEGFKYMSQLRLLSLQGVSAVTELPDSVCKLVNLKILDLRECHALQELPANFGALKNLTHLDVSSCHLLYKMPKGISLLSRLEVLKGFAVYGLLGHVPQHKTLDRVLMEAKRRLIHDVLHLKNSEVCTIRDLLKLACLRELSLVVSNVNFPDSEELKVFRQMENLRKLGISWQRSIMDDGDKVGEISIDATEHQGALFKEAECKDSCTARPEKHTNQNLGQIEKLELSCFPGETVPHWLVPDQLKNLHKLYIKGGKLQKLSGGSSGYEWKVSTLRLRHLPELVVTWTDLKAMFPNLTYLEKYECKQLRVFPCDDEGVWRAEYELL